MEEVLENKQQATASTNKTETPKRSASYPALPLLKAFSFAEKVYNKFSNIEATRKEIASEFGVNDVTISRDVAAAAAYGFLDKTLVKGEAEFKYKVTQLFDDIFRYENEKQKKLALITAFGNPKLFQELISKFDGQIIPEDLLPNTLIKHHNITEKAAKDVATIFISSGIEADVINESRLLNYRVKQSAISKTQYAEVTEDPLGGELVNPVVKVEKINELENDIKIPIHLTKNKMAYMAYPSDINENDIKLLEHAIQGILLRLRLENDTDSIDNKSGAKSPDS